MLELGYLLSTKFRATRNPLRLDPTEGATHLALIGQSGSGKSFFLGRLIEELVTKTRAKVILLDPNSDFVRIQEVNGLLWSSREDRYKKLRTLLFPGESKRRFERAWMAARKVVCSNRNLEVQPKRIRVNWGLLNSLEMLTVLGINERLDAGLYWYLICTRAMCEETVKDAYDFTQFRRVAGQIMRSLAGEKDGFPEFDSHEVNRLLSKSTPPSTALRFIALLDSLAEYGIWWSTDQPEPAFEDIGQFLERELSADTDPVRLVEIDLQSLVRDGERLWVLSRVLSTLWEVARARQSDRILDPGDKVIESSTPDLVRERVPIFIVIDEAHNLVPAEAGSQEVKLISEQLIRIAAEGRKFDLFLLVSTQRPKKVHASILTECDNLFLMKMTNQEDFEYLRTATGKFTKIDPALTTRMSKGNVLVVGSLVPDSILFATSPRRTVEGGASLPDSWAVPYE